MWAAWYAGKSQPHGRGVAIGNQANNALIGAGTLPTSDAVYIRDMDLNQSTELCFGLGGYVHGAACR